VIKKAAWTERRLKMQVKYRCRDRLRRSFCDPGLHLLHHGRLSSGIVDAVYIRFAQFTTEMVNMRHRFDGPRL
jgi:hypothetical protein